MESADALVVGGGGLGLATAWRLAQKGLKVRVLERNRDFAREATFAAAGMIGPQSEALEDDAYFAATLASRDRWPAFAAELENASGLSIGYHSRGCIHLAFGASSQRRLESKYLWQKRRAGAVTRLEGDELFRRFPLLGPRVTCAFFAEGDHWVDNEQLGLALTKACASAGADLVAGAGVSRLEREGPRWVAQCQDGRRYSATHLLVAAGAWVKDLLAPLLDLDALKCFPVKGQMLELKVPPELLPEVPVHAENVYLVPRGTDRLLVGATMETLGFDKRVTAEGIEYLLMNAFETAPDLRPCELTRTWAGLRPASPDGWPVLGPAPLPGLHFALGAYRRGILLMPLAAESAAAGILGLPLPSEAAAFGASRAAA
ncbi:MAG TPA: glycine oxidase ThiO [bacterium]|jgi:glycine oxidase|nr:glycine oxidase ThiO [bacterium]